jgi:Holliday junction resolvasome RuvABC endonuclease subunit
VTLPLELTIPGAALAVAPGARPRILGLDLSITCTGLSGPDWTDTIKPSKKLDTLARMDVIVRDLVDRFIGGVDLVALEGIAMAAHDTNRQIAGLNWVVRRELWKRGVPFASVPPMTLKQYIAGKGNASKADVVREVTRRFPWFEGGEDEADAVALAAMAAERVGSPMAFMPKAQRDAAMAKVVWPALILDEVAA